MGMISKVALGMDADLKVESFESRFARAGRSRYLFVSDSATITGGYTQVTSISERGPDLAGFSKTSLLFTPKSNLLRRTLCRAISNYFSLSGLLALWRPVRPHRLSRNPSWFRSSRKNHLRSTKINPAGLVLPALLIPAPIARRRVAC